MPPEFDPEWEYAVGDPEIEEIIYEKRGRMVDRMPHSVSVVDQSFSVSVYDTKRFKILCKRCGSVKRCYTDQQIYCSRKCYRKDISTEDTTVKCPTCHNNFTYKKTRSVRDRRYCSYKCYYSADVIRERSRQIAKESRSCPIDLTTVWQSWMLRSRC